MPPIPWLASGSAFTCCRDASTSTGTRWDSSRAMPRPRRCAPWSSGRPSVSTAGSARIRPGSPSARSWGRSSRRWSGPSRRRSSSPARRRSTSTPSPPPSTDRMGRGGRSWPPRSISPPMSTPCRVSSASTAAIREHDLVLVPSRDGRTIAEEDVIAALERRRCAGAAAGRSLPLGTAPRHSPSRGRGAGPRDPAGVRLRALDRRRAAPLRRVGCRLGVLVFL